MSILSFTAPSFLHVADLNHQGSVRDVSSGKYGDYQTLDKSGNLRKVTNLLPDELLENGDGASKVFYLNGTQVLSHSEKKSKKSTAAANRIKGINAYSFSGGGASITYNESNSHEQASFDSLKLHILTSALPSIPASRFFIPSGIEYHAEDTFLVVKYTGDQRYTLQRVRGSLSLLF